MHFPGWPRDDEGLRTISLCFICFIHFSCHGDFKHAYTCLFFKSPWYKRNMYVDILTRAVTNCSVIGYCLLLDTVHRTIPIHTIDFRWCRVWMSLFEYRSLNDPPIKYRPQEHQTSPICYFNLHVLKSIQLKYKISAVQVDAKGSLIILNKCIDVFIIRKF